MTQMSQQNQQNSIQLNAFSVMSTWLHAEPVEGSTKRPNLRFNVIGNVPRISVRTNVPNDPQYGRIDFKTDLATFAAAMHYAKQLASGADVPQERRFTYEDDFLAGKKLDRPMVLSTLMIGREAESGRIYIGVISSQQQRPRIRFFFGPSKYHSILNGDGTPITPKEMSEAYAMGFLVPAEQLTYQLLIKDFDENAKNVANPANFTQGNGGGNGGGQRPQYNNNQGGGNGGYSKPPAQNFDTGFDDKLPNF